MKYKIYITALFTVLLALIMHFSHAQSISFVSVVQENIKVAGITTDAAADALTVNDKQTIYQYYDGFGRPLQTINKQASPSKADLIQPQAYDYAGRQSVSYLPYTDGLGTAEYRYDALTTGQPGFYTNTGSHLVARDDSAYSKQLFEESPLQRVLASGMAGAGFQPGGGAGQHFKTIAYRSNSNTLDGHIMLWNFNGTFTAGTFYDDNTLSVTDGKDEDGTETLTFTDVAGRMILKRQIHSGGNYDTYYIYNAAGMISYVMPPKATAAFVPGSSSLTAAPFNAMVFRYTYDTRGRLITRTAPAQAAVYFVYDAWNRLVLMQDANLRTGNKWNYIKYDSKNRPVSQGIYVDATHTGQSAMQTYAATFTTNWYESRSGTLTNHGYYTSTAFPSTGITPLAYAYYDNYDLNGNGSDDFGYKFQGDASLPDEEHATTAKLKGVPTVTSKTTVGGGITANTWLTSAVFYDKRGNAIQVRSNNHIYHSGDTVLTDAKTIVPDFTGVPQTTKVVKQTASGTTVTVYTAFTYDHMNRLSTLSQKYNTGSMQQIAAYTYNELGQAVKKGLGLVASGTIPATKNLTGTFSGTNTEVASDSITFTAPMSIPSGAVFKAFISPGYLQIVDYRYNIRGQMLSINNSRLNDDGGITNADNADVLGMQFLYDKTDAGIGNSASFNGKLTAVKWMSMDGSGTNTKERSYSYNYDDLGRYTSSLYGERAAAGTGAFSFNANGFNEYGITYDANGNITHLNRTSASTDGLTHTTIDNLTYTYSTSSPDRLQSVSDAGTGTGFPGGTGSYVYDTNGNLNTDPYKHLSNSYNVLNRTDTIKITNVANRYITYTYDANGTLLRKRLYDNTGGAAALKTTTDYIDGFVYQATGAGAAALSYFPMPEGRVLYGGGSFTQEFVLTDPQGNARISFQRSGTEAKVIQENSYYGYGMAFLNSPVPTPTSPNKQLYNGGSEWQNDYSNAPDYYQTYYRNYDAVLGRFAGVDPEAESAESMGTYQYAADNPVSNNDPLGNNVFNPGQASNPWTNPGIPKIGYDGVLHWQDGDLDNPGGDLGNGGYSGNAGSGGWSIPAIMGGYVDLADKNQLKGYPGATMIYLTSGNGRNSGYSKSGLLDDLNKYLINAVTGDDVAGSILLHEVKITEAGWKIQQEAYESEFYNDANQGGSSWLSDAYDWTKNHFYEEGSYEISRGTQLAIGIKKGLDVTLNAGSTVMYSGKVTNRNLKFEMDNSKRFTHEIGAAWIVGGGVKYTHDNVNPGEVELSIGALGFLGGSVTLDTNGNVTNWFGGINIDAHIAVYFGIQGTYKLGFAK